MRSVKLYTLLFVLNIGVTVTPARAQVVNTNAATTVTDSPVMHEKEVPVDVSSDWYAKAVAGIQQMQEQFYAQPSHGAFRVTNSANRLSFYIHPGGYTVHGLQQNQKQPAWQVAFKLEGIGRPAVQWMPSSDFTIHQSARQLSYCFNGVQVDYLNNNDGLRQNFVVHKKMPGKGALAVTIALQGDLLAGLPADNQLTFYSADDHSILLTYEDLKVWDAQQRPLPASMHLNNGSLTIEVDDSHAVYPITIDPLNKTPEWTTSADGVLATTLSQAQLNAALYGYAVSGLGDVNGDGYGDVAVSAPSLIDVISGTGTLAGVGAVFVFYGSASGLSTTPAKTLQPNTAVAGALFGYSVDAGDLTGDGINDIIIGAPLDSYQTTAAGVLGTVSVTVKAGKVYVYPGGTGGTPNPSNFIEVKLQGSGFFSTGIGGLLLSNTGINALFGFSVAATNDLNGDNKADLIVGAPSYLGTSLLSIKNGSAFVYYSSDLTTSTPVQLQTPDASLLGLPSLVNTGGLLYGFSVDGLGDYNNDGYADVVVGAPAGIELSSLGALFTGQVLGGSAYVYYGNGTGMANSIGAKLEATSGGLLGNAANLFGYKVKGARNALGARTGGIIIGAPVGGLVPNLLSLTIQTGNVHVFKRKSNLPAGTVTSDQVLESPRSTSLLQVLNSLNLNVLFGAAIDNAWDVNCDGYGDLVVGEPLSSGATLAQLQANAVGGAAFVYLGDGTGGYVPSPVYDVATSYGSDFLSVNATSLFGFSVAGAPNTRGTGSSPRILVGSPSGALDFDNSLLNLGSTLGLLFDFAVGDNGLGKAYVFNPNLCMAGGLLPLTLLEFKGQESNRVIDLFWKTTHEENVSLYEVQRSTDGLHFETIGLVFSIESSSSNLYKFSDQHPAPGINYYRLNMVDKDKSQKHSNLISFRVGATTETGVAIHPNPTSGSIRMQFNGISNNTYRIELRNAVGQLIQTKTINITRYGQTEYLMRPVSMAPGTYFILVYEKNNKLLTSDRVIVQ
jgi:hypothetical protein